MPEATPHPTPTRRLFIGGATTALLAGSAVAALASPVPAHPDADLLAACANYHAASDALRTGDALDDDTADDLAFQSFDAFYAVSTTPAKTLEGLRARARVAREETIARVTFMNALSWKEQAEPFDILVVSIFSDLSGEG